MQKTRYSFDKKVSSQLKSFALVLMIMHHLWHLPYFALFEPIEYEHLLLSIGMLGKICVGMFLFVSGYGLMASYCAAGNGFHIWRRLKKVLLPFWLIVILVAPFLLIIHEVKWFQVVTDAMLLTRNMNGNWWFMQTYVIYVICFPLFAKSLQYIVIIMFLIDIQGYLSDKVKRGFDFLGKMSMNMWLIHLFFVNYGFHFRNPFADLAWIYLESLVAAYIIWFVYHKLCGSKW